MAIGRAGIATVVGNIAVDGADPTRNGHARARHLARALGPGGPGPRAIQARAYRGDGHKRVSGAGGEGWGVGAGVASPGDSEGPRPASWAPRSSGIVTNA